ncbi:unnamed protein product [marine sediment metagenome]|uniref:Uncharacterized protein n=1 Tax=marine sediment metagenome TaxID=412755 RepID=X1B622_9ZZZZ
MKSRKEVNHGYYMRKIRPFRKNKGEAQLMKTRCLLCGHWINYQKYFEKSPSLKIEIKLWRFGGRANIKVSDYAKLTPELRESLNNIIKDKLKMLLRALGEDLEPKERVVEIYQTPISRETYNVESVEDRIPIKETMDVKIW